MALLVGLTEPATFGRVGLIQPAILGRVPWAARVLSAPGHPAQSFRLLTSSGDAFRPVTRDLDATLTRLGLAHELLELPGPHDYAFNRGPGSVELVRFHTGATTTVNATPHSNR